MTEPQVSVIVPVYNAEAYLYRCVDSILAQTMSDFELILVDDGSPDKCGEICDEYARKDSRIRVIHQPNRGVSFARQVGHDASIGKYSIHVDPDDWVESTMLEELHRKAEIEEADMVICDYFEHKERVQNYVVQQPLSLDPKAIVNQMVTTFSGFQPLYGSCWNKLIRRSCYNSEHNCIRFEPCDLSVGEDVVFNCRLLLNTVKRISYLNKAFYHYEIRGGSLCDSIGKNIQYLIEIQENLIKDKDIIDRLSLKPLHLQLLFDQKEFKKMKNLYPYTQAAIISRYPHSILTLALKGYPRIAYLCRKLQLFYKSLSN